MFVSATMAGVVTGSYYAFLGIAIALIFRTTGVANFAQGHQGTLGVFIFFMYTSHASAFRPISIICALLISALIGGAIYFVILRPRADNDPMNATARTLGLYVLLQALMLYFWGENEPYVIASFLPKGSIEFANLVFSYDQLCVLGIAIALSGAFLALLRYTKVGLAIRSVAADKEVASLLGINTHLVSGVVWCVAGAIGTIVAGLIAPMSFLGTNLMEPYLLKAFTAAILGGLSSFPGVLAGGLILGILDSYAASWMPLSAREPFTFAILLAVLIVRPTGLFGKISMERV